MRGNSLVFIWKIEGTDPRRNIMHGEHDDWAEMMRFAEYAVHKLGIKDSCNVMWKRLGMAGVFPLGPMYTDSRLYRRAREVWDEVGGRSFGRGKVWPKRTAMAVRGWQQEADDALEGFTATAVKSSTGGRLVAAKPRPQLGRRNRSSVVASDSGPRRQRGLDLG